MKSSLVLLCCCCAGGVARADADADALLDRVDRAVAGAANRVWICRMRSIGTDGNVREGRFLMLQNAADKRILRFLSPRRHAQHGDAGARQGRALRLPAGRSARPSPGLERAQPDLPRLRLQRRGSRLGAAARRLRRQGRRPSRATRCASSWCPSACRAGRASSPSSSSTIWSRASSTTIAPAS